MREAIQRIRSEVRDCQTELGTLTKGWVAGRIDDAEYDRRAAESSLRLDALRAQRTTLHDRSVESLTSDDLDALVADLVECREAAIKHKEEVRSLPWTQRSERQSQLQALAAEIDRYTLRLETLGKLDAREDTMVEWADCRYCGHRIARLADVDAVWLHCDINGMPLQFWGGRGCRAASFDRDGDWNDALRKKWLAAPEPGTETHLVPRLLVAE